MANDTLPTGQDLAARLYAQGLAPEECQEMPSHSTPPLWYRLGDTEWQPWCRIEHAWYLVEQFTLSFDFHPATTRNDGRVRPASWWVGQSGERGAIVYTFAEVPTAICWAAILAQEWRAEA